MSFNYRNYGSISKLFGATEVDQQTETDGPEAPELYFASSLCLYQKRKEKKRKTLCTGTALPFSAQEMNNILSGHKDCFVLYALFDLS